MASEAYRLAARYKFLVGEIDVLEAQLEHRRDDLLVVTDRMAEMILAPETDGEVPTPGPKVASRTSTPPREQEHVPGGKEVPDFSGTPLALNDRVKVLVRGKYKGRVGKVTKIFGDGTHFVYVTLDPLPGGPPGEGTQKAPTSLQKLRWVQDA